MEMLSHTPSTQFYPTNSDAEWVPAEGLPVSQEEHSAHLLSVSLFFFLTLTVVPY